MFNVFSHRLIERIRLKEQAVMRKNYVPRKYTLKEAVQNIQTGDVIPQIVISEHVPENQVDMLYYEVATNQSLRKVLQFVTDKILIELPEQYYKTTDVRLRIFTSMLNKAVENGDVDRAMAVGIHLNVIDNIVGLMGDMYAEDLPF